MVKLSLLRCFGICPRKSDEKTDCSVFSRLSADDEDVLVEREQQEPAESESDIKGHLLLRVLGGEDYGSISAATCKMDSELWSMLPEELLLRVPLYLPSISKLRCRAVCKEWRRLLSLSSSSSELDTKASTALLCPPRTPLFCAYRFIHGNWLRDRGIHGDSASVARESRDLQRKLRCHGVQLLFPGIDPPDFKGQGCRIDCRVSADDGVLSVEICKERLLPHGKLRRHRGVPTILDLFTFLVNPITKTVLSTPQLRTEGDHSLRRNLGLVSSRAVLKNGLFHMLSFYWTCWWLDVGIGLEWSTSWFTRVRQHPIEVGRYPESVNVRDRTGERNLIGIDVAELEAGKFQTVISDGVVYGVHYLPDGSNRLFTRALEGPVTKEWSLWPLWHDDASVPKVSDAIDGRFFLVEHRISQSVFFVGQSCHKSGKLIFRICRLQSDCFPTWFWMTISFMPSALVDDILTRVGTTPPRTSSSFHRRSDCMVLDRAFSAGDSIILVFRSFSPPSRVCFVAFDVYEETWQNVLTEADSEELAEFDGFFEVRPDVRFPHHVKEGLKLY